MFAQVVLDVSLDRAFDYAIPAELAESAVPGCRVKVPFGRRTASGYVIGVSGTTPVDPAQVKSLLSVEGDLPFLLPGVLKLARWIASYYIAPIERCVRAVLPAAVQEGRSRPRERLFVDLAEPPEASGGGDSAPPAPLSARQQELLDNVRRVGGGWLQSLCKEFRCAPDTLKRLAEAGHLVIGPRESRRDPLARRRLVPTHPLDLTPEQSRALAILLEECASPAPRPVLLHGVTGSGKTEVYLQAIAAMLGQGRGAIVLVPEISLTPQTVQRFASRFGDRVAVLHSALSDGERHDEWHRIRTGKARVVVGPRSAVFAPVENLGLIVVDEEHDSSYKQNETPRYNARDVAVMRAHFERCGVLLGSATPSLESWANAERGKYRKAVISARVDDHPMPLVRVVDMRIETVKKGHACLLSDDLLQALDDRLKAGEQAILFLNRRGFATSLQCPLCGYVATCDACSLPFTYHRADECLRCHICGAWKHPPAVCPQCEAPSIRYSGFGTQRLESVVRTCFPSARIDRIDADVTSRRHSHDEILGAFRTGKTDILIGTQMIAKGLHFPNVTLVGVVSADSSLHLPDFRAGERTFQLLTQVSGRAGRGDIPGEVIIQTYTPAHPAVALARTADFPAFASAELVDRRDLFYPPFAHLACVTLKGPDEPSVEQACQALAAACRRFATDGMKISEPGPAPLSRARNAFRYQVILRAPAAGAAGRLLRRALETLRLPKNVSVAIDIDAVDIL
ncbi:MAG: replication restart helicase PriA [Kiritimatiellia bacterium]|jgi:primosomal protein N' (replication factor Y)